MFHLRLLRLLAIKPKKIIKKDNECIESCKLSSRYKYEYNGNCIDSCEKGFLYDKNNNTLNKCKCELDECLLCPNVALQKELCIECNINYYPKENDPLNIGEYIKCYKDPEGYYLDNNLYKECFNMSNICNTSQNNLTDNCTYLNKSSNYYKSCYLKNINIKNSQYIERNKLNSTQLITDKSQNSNLNNIDEEVKNIQDYITNGINTTSIDNGKDYIIPTEKINYTITTTKNQKNQINENVTTRFRSM